MYSIPFVKNMELKFSLNQILCIKRFNLQKALASFLVFIVFFTSLPFYSLALEVSGSIGDDDIQLVVGGSIGDEEFLPVVSDHVEDEKNDLPVLSDSLSDDISVPTVSGSLGDENPDLLVSGSTGDEQIDLPLVSSSGGDGNDNAPIVSGSVGDEDVNTPLLSGSTGDEVGNNNPIVSGSVGDENDNLPLVSGSVGDEGENANPAVSGSTGDEYDQLPTVSGSIGDENTVPLVVGGSVGDEESSLPPVCPTISIESPLNVSVTTSSYFSYAFNIKLSPVSSDILVIGLVGTLPTGLIFDAGNLVISGIPTQSGVYNVMFRAGIPCRSMDFNIEITVNPAPVVSCPIPSISSSLSVSANESQYFSYSFSGAISPSSVTSFFYSVSNLPAGLSFDQVNGVISGTPTQNGVFNVPVTVSIPCGPTVSNAVLVLNINSVPPALCPIQNISSPNSASGEVKKAFSHVFTTTSNPVLTTVPAITISGTLPSGLSFSPITSTISGTPLEAGNFNLSVTVTNLCGVSSSNLVITINPESTSGGGGGSGGGSPVIPTPSSGGGGGNTRLISNLAVCQADATSVEISWNTNKPSIGRVLFSTSTVLYLTNKDFFGYSGATDRTKDFTLGHKALISNLASGTQYFARPMVSILEGGFESSGDEVGFIPGAVAPCSKKIQEEVEKPKLDSCPFIIDYMRIDLDNKKEEVLKLQNFLKNREGYGVEETGIFDEKTDLAVKAFQTKYFNDVLSPWGANSEPTGYVYITTKNKINEIVCGSSNLTDSEKKIVDEYVQFNESVKFGTTTPSNIPDSDIREGGDKQATTTIIGRLDGSLKGELGVKRGELNSNVAIVLGSATSTGDGFEESTIYCSSESKPGLIDKTIYFFSNLLRPGDK